MYMRHVYVDELWVEPSYRKRRLASALMQKAEELVKQLDASGERLYVNINNPEAKRLYERCGYQGEGTAIFMEKNSD